MCVSVIWAISMTREVWLKSRAEAIARGKDLRAAAGFAGLSGPEARASLARAETPSRHLPGSAPRWLRLRGGRVDRGLSGGARRQPPLLLAVSAGGEGQPARLRHRRSAD